MTGIRTLRDKAGRIIILVLNLIYFNVLSAQTSDLYLNSNTSIFFFSKDTAAVFGNIMVNGNLAQETGSYLYFFGKKWINTKTASLRDESPGGYFNIGGTVNFQQPNPLYGDMGRQGVIGGYDANNLTGPNFASIILNNTNGLGLEDSTTDLGVRHNLALNKGKVYLNGSSLLLGSAAERGYISGYTDQHYIVTGAQSVGGFVHFLNIPRSNDSIVFPVGSTDTSYTPLSLNNQGATDHFKARVFDKVFSQGLGGTDISDHSVNKTWLLAAVDQPLNGSVTLQHNIPEESIAFFDNREGSYVAQNVNGAYDVTDLYSSIPKNPGLLTTGSPITTAATNTRLFTNGQAGSLYILSKLTLDTTRYDYPRELIDFTATRLSPILARLEWHAVFTSRIQRFEIQKRKTNELNWTTVGAVDATAALSYSWPDADVYYPDPIYYRLNIVYKLGATKFSEIRSIPGVGKNFALAYPNPTPGEFTVTVADYTQVSSIGLYDYLGHKLQETTVVGPNTHFDISRYASSIYLVVIISKDKQLITTLKVIKEK